MTAPNIGGFTMMTGNTAVQLTTTVPTPIVSNNVSSNQLFKIYSLTLCNITNSLITANVDIYRSSIAYHLAANLVIPGTSTLALITKDNGVYLNEGDSLRISTAANASVESVCSYEVVA